MHHEEASTSSARSNITSSEGSKSSEQSDGSSQQASRWNITCRCTVNVYPLFISTKKARLMATLKPEWEFGFGPLDFLRFFGCCSVQRCFNIFIYLFVVDREFSTWQDDSETSSGIFKVKVCASWKSGWCVPNAELIRGKIICNPCGQWCRLWP